MNIKTTVLLTLICYIIGLSSFRPQVSASIVGSWTQTEAIHLTKRPGTSVTDTTISHDRGFAITFTADSQYHFTAPYGHKADGSYIISGDTLTEVSQQFHSSSLLHVVTLTEHSLVTRANGTGAESRAVIITTYSR